MVLTASPFACYANGIMASPGGLVAVIADTLGVPRGTVAQYDRVLAENGLRSSGGRGLSAAKITAADAANLLIAIMGSPISGAAIKEAAKTCEVYGALPWIDTVRERQKLRSYGFKRLADLPAEHSLREALIILIEGAVPDASGYYAGAGCSVRIELMSPFPWAGISIRDSAKPVEAGAMMAYHQRFKGARSPKMYMYPAQKDLQQTRQVTFETVKRLAAIVQSG